MKPNGESVSFRDMRIFCFGEALLCSKPIPPAALSVTESVQLPQGVSMRIESIGGSELNTAIALSRLGMDATWSSVLPCGPLGDRIIHLLNSSGVTANVTRIPGDIGTLHVVPSSDGSETVHFQRRSSVFADHPPLTDFDLCNYDHVHLTGITPAINAATQECWSKIVKGALHAGTMLSLDLNHRPALIEFRDLLAVVERCSQQFEWITMSKSNLIEAAPAAIKGSLRDCLVYMAKHLGTSIICCVKSEKEAGAQARHSMISLVRHPQFGAIQRSGVVYESRPTTHYPVDPIGGGDAWTAGFIKALAIRKHPHLNEILKEDLIDCLEAGDTMAALKQNTPGDFSNVTEAEFLAALKHLNSHHERVLYRHSLPKSDRTSTLSLLSRVKVVPVFRAPNVDFDVGLRRCTELIELGCLAVEVTMDTNNALRLVKVLRTHHPSILVGVGTVMTLEEIAAAAEVGAQFAVSPIHPKDFVVECHKYGLVAVPAASTPTEMWNCNIAGADIVKLYPANCWSPAMFKGLPAPLRKLKVMPSGGIKDDNVRDWLDAGVVAVGMGGGLVGSDISLPKETPQKKRKCESEKWEQEGRGKVQRLMESLLGEDRT